MGRGRLQNCTSRIHQLTFSKKARYRFTRTHASVHSEYPAGCHQTGAVIISEVEWKGDFAYLRTSVLFYLKNYFLMPHFSESLKAQ